MAKVNIVESMEEVKHKSANTRLMDVKYDALLEGKDSLYEAFDLKDYVDEICKLNHHREVCAYWEIGSTRKILGGITVFFKKVIRRLISFYVEPMVEEQNRVNEIVTNIAIMSARECRQSKEQIDALNSRIAELEEIVRKMGA